MSRRKNVVKGLLDSAESAFFAGIEIHNKPHISYRYPTVSILMINAWELLLKAYVYKNINKKRIYEENGHTISFSKALSYVGEDINSKEGHKVFASIKENLNILDDYRNNNAHYFEGDLDPIIFMIISKAAINFNNFIFKYFHKEVASDKNLFIMPIGFKLPFDPIDYLNKRCEHEISNAFLSRVIQSIHKLNKDEINDSIVVGFNMFTSSIKNVANADIVAAIDPTNTNAVPLTKEYRVTDNPDAPLVKIDETRYL